MTEKFVGYFRLVEACAQPGCPVCRCLVAESRRYLDALLYEQVTDPDTRRAIRRSWGFCNWHTWMLPDIESSAFGAAIVCEDLVTLALRRAQRRRRGSRLATVRRWLAALARPRRRPALVERWERRTPCPACADAAATETRYLDTMLAFVEDDALRAAYARSDGLCVPHLVRAVEQGREDGPADTLVARTRETWARLGRDLAAFVRKHDYRNREPYTPGEASACARAFEMLSGAPGVFGPAARGTADMRGLATGPPRPGAAPRAPGRSSHTGADS
jgi:hypothetical protein